MMQILLQEVWECLRNYLKNPCICIVSTQTELQTASTILLGQTQNTQVKSSFYFRICGVRVSPSEFNRSIPQMCHSALHKDHSLEKCNKPFSKQQCCEGLPKLQDFTMFVTNKPMQEQHISSSARAPAISWHLLDGLIQTLSKTWDYAAPRLFSQILPALNNSLTSALGGALILVLKAAYHL